MVGVQCLAPIHGGLFASKSFGQAVACYASEFHSFQLCDELPLRDGQRFAGPVATFLLVTSGPITVELY